MAQFVKGFERSFVTGSVSLATKQFFIVKQHTDGTVILSAAATDKHVGIVQNKPAIGAAANIQILGTAKVIAGGAISVGAWVTSDGSGQAVATTNAGDVIIGKYLGVAAAASGDIIEVQLSTFVL